MYKRQDHVGGLAASASVHGADGAAYRLDTRPTVLTMPALLARPFEDLGEDLADWVTLHRLDPAYRMHFADGSSLDVSADPPVMAERIAAFAGPRDAQGYLRWVDWVSRLYAAQFPTFIDADVDSVLRLVNPHLARVAALRGFGRLGRAVARFVADDRLRRVLSFQALYAGVSPARALALYAVIGYMDLVEGVSYPEGGMSAVPEAMAAAARAHGVQIVTDTAATGVTWRGGRAVEVHAGERSWPCEELVVTPDAPAAYRLLGRDPAKVDARRHSPSCVVLAAGLTSRQLGVQTEMEDHFRLKAEEIVAQVVGRGNARVQVAASMNFDRVERTTQIVVRSRRGSRQIRHVSSSETLKHRSQNRTFSVTSRRASARRITSSFSAVRM